MAIQTNNKHSYHTWTEDIEKNWYNIKTLIKTAAKDSLGTPLNITKKD